MAIPVMLGGGVSKLRIRQNYTSFIESITVLFKSNFKNFRLEKDALRAHQARGGGGGAYSEF